MSNPNEGLRCPTRQAVLRELVAAVVEAFDLGTREIAAITSGESLAEIDHIGRNLEQSMLAKAALLQKYKDHVRSHGCA